MNASIKKILNNIPADSIIGLRTTKDSYNNMSYGRVLALNNQGFIFEPYFDDGTPCPNEHISYSKIISLEINTKDTCILKKIVNTKLNFSAIQKKIYSKGEISPSILKDMLQYNNLAVFHINKDYYTGYLLDFNKHYFVLQTLDPMYNIDYGISYYPLENLKELILNEELLNAYPYLYDNSITRLHKHFLLQKSKYDFFKEHETDHKIIDLEDSCNIKEGVTTVGFVNYTTPNTVSISVIDKTGCKTKDVIYNFDDIINYGIGGFYLTKIDLLYKNNLYHKSKRKIIALDNLQRTYKIIYQAKLSKNIISLISDKTANEYYETTGFIIDLIGGWVKFKAYDIEEDDWYDYYRKAKDFTDIRYDSYIELLVKEIKKQ